MESNGLDTGLEEGFPLSQDVSREGRRLLRELVVKSRGAIKFAMVVSPEGLSLFHYLPEEYDPDSLSAATIAMIGALTSALGILGKSGYTRLDVELDDGTHLIIAPMEDYALIVSTGSKPNLGLVYLLVDAYSEKILQFIRENLRMG